MLTDAQLQAALAQPLDGVDLSAFGQTVRGKVRDMALSPGRRVLVTTDRLSAFDRVIGLIPYKGQLLNQLAAFWFERTNDILPNHVFALPDPNVTIAREAQPLPVEVVVRRHITGVTSTSLWTLYKAGVSRPYGLSLPVGPGGFRHGRSFLAARLNQRWGVARQRRRMSREGAIPRCGGS